MNVRLTIKSLLCLAKIENAPLAEHIVDVHRLNLEITEVQILHSSSQQERVERVETFSDRLFPELSRIHSRKSTDARQPGRNDDAGHRVWGMTQP